MYFSTLNSTMKLKLLYHPQFLCDRIFFKYNFSDFFATLPEFLKAG